MKLVETKIVATISDAAAANSDDVQFDILADDVSDALEVGLAAVLESIRLRFPTVQFTVEG